MLQTVISIMFYLTFIIYAFLGVFCFALNKNATLNRVFLLVCFSFSIWAFAFAVSNSLNHVEDVIFWRRVASLGWGVAFSFIVHFILILTQKQNWLTNKIVYIAIYLPAGITVFVFGLYGKLANAQYNLVHTEAGWGNIAVNNIWDAFYNLYYLSFSIFILYLLIKWYQNSDDATDKKQALSMLLAFSLSVAIGTVSEMLVNNYLSEKTPSVAPIIILIPVTAFSYNIRKYGFMTPDKSKKIRDAREILSNATHSTFIRYIAIGYLSVSFFNILQTFFYPTVLWSDMLFSTIFVIMGLFIYSLTVAGLSIMAQDRIMTALITLTMPLTFFRFHENQMSNVLWTIPLIYLMMTIIFNYKKMFAMIAVVSTIIGILSCIIQPEQFIHVGTVDYFARLVIYSMVIILAAFINRIYVARLKENEHQVRFQKMISSITTSFIAITSENFDNKVTELLKRSGSYINADRAYICSFSKNIDTFSYAYRWLDEHVKPTIRETENYETTAFSWCKERLLNNQIVYLPNPGALPLEADEERAEILKHQIQSIIGV
ncbi:hypothetical protein GH810_17125, partial [Acetobacterium paludosum]